VPEPLVDEDHVDGPVADDLEGDMEVVDSGVVRLRRHASRIAPPMLSAPVRYSVENANLRNVRGIQVGCVIRVEEEGT
jgi:hypothetical protein